MNFSKFIWFWQRHDFLGRDGWRVDGGLWPIVRIVRRAQQNDFYP